MARSNKFDEEWNNSWKKIKLNDYIGLQRALRKIKSNLNNHLGTIEVLECANKWSDIKISSIPAKHMTSRRRALNNEKSLHDRTDSNYDISDYPFGDKNEKPFIELIPDEEIRMSLLELSNTISEPGFKNRVKQFKEQYKTILSTAIFDCSARSCI